MERDDLFVHTMNTKPHISIILTILSILSLALAAQAQNLVVSNSAYPAVSGTHYENYSYYSALTVTGSLGSFTGTNIILTGTAASGNGRFGASVGTQGKLALANSSINSNSAGAYLTGTSNATFNNVNITAQADYGVYVGDSSTATITGGTIATVLTGYGVNATGMSRVTLQDTTINASAIGIYNYGASVVTAKNVNIITGTSANAYGADAIASSTLNLNGGAIRTSGNSAYAIYASGTSSTAIIVGSTITTSGTSSHGIYVNVSANAIANNVVINTSGYRALGVSVDTGALSVTGGTINTTGENAHGAYLGNSGDIMNLTNVIIHASGSGAAGVMLMATNPSPQTLTITGGTIVSGQSAGLQINEQTRHVANPTYNGIYNITLTGGAQITGQTGIYIDSNWLASDGITYIDVPTAATVNVDQASLINGGVNLQGSATLALGLNNRSQLNGDILAGGTATLAIVGNNNSAITGNVTGTGASVTNIALTNSTLTGKTTVADTATLNLSLFDSGTWYMVDNSTLTNLTAAKTARVNFPAPTAAGNYHTLTVRNNLGGEGGTFAMHTDIAAGKADLLSVGGTASTGAHRISLTNANDNAITGSESPLLLVETAGGSATFTGTTTAGVYDYSVQNGAQVGDAFALPDTNWYLYRAGISNIGNAIIATSAMLGYDWFYSLDALYLRMGDVREENLARTTTLNSGTTTAASGNVWVRARGYRLNADASLSGRPFNEYAYGLTAGADKAFHRNTTSTTLLGGFLDAGRIDRDFSGDNNINVSNSNNTGYTTSLSAGLYATYLRQNGWHADLVLKADRYKHHFDTTTADQLPVTGDYSNNALGASLEIGRRLTRADGYWVEPMLQAAYTWLGSATYRTAPANATLGVTVDSTRAAQYRALVRFGRRVQNSRWSPYGKFGVVRTALTGGALHIDDGAGTIFVPDCEGWRVEFGVGTSYYINARSQLYFDYEYDRAPHYERPWALNLGYRHGW